MRATVSPSLQPNNTNVEELLDLVVGVADRFAPEDRELSAKDRWLVELAQTAVRTGELSAALWGGTAGASIATALGALPIMELGRWLFSFRKLSVKLAGASVAVAEGVPAEVDLAK